MLVDEMKKKMSELERQEKRSAVLKSISNQMEEITYQQMKLSDEQRLEAIEQRERAEQERRNAVQVAYCLVLTLTSTSRD